MTIKEITALRKSGLLSEAMAAAETEFTKAANQYTAGALFWCLNDLFKQQSGDDAVAIFERMKALYDGYSSGDDYMQKAMISAEKRIMPHFVELRTAVEDARNGADAISLHKQISLLYNNNELDTRLYPDFGWLTYYALKQTNLSDVHNRKSLLNMYLQLDLPKPSILHSLILSEAVKVEKNTPLQFRIRDFIRLWGLENLRAEDWEQFQTANGNTMPSLVEKLISVYVKEIETDHVEAPNDFCQLVDKALEAFPGNQNLPLYKANVLISQGKTDEALSYYKNMILRTPSKFFLWSHAAELTDDIDTKVGLLCKALTCGVEDKFIVNVRLALAKLLIQIGMPEYAKYELEKYRQTYQNNGWNIKADFYNLYNQLQSPEAVDSNNEIYGIYSAKADEFIYSAFPTILAVKVDEQQNSDRNHPGRKITTWILRTEKSTERLRKPTKYGLSRHTPNGAAFDIKVDNGKIVWIKQHTGPINESWLNECSGDVHIRTNCNGRSYALISDTYVGDKLLKGISEGQHIKVLSIKQADARWRAIAILKH
ncbi:MAG: DUF7017 domain-containing protein [Muribaculaceae bacterium]